MRGVKIFAGNSHPQLTAAICERLGMAPASAKLTKFSNGETRVDIGTSIRDEDVFVVQSGSMHTNDSVIELLIMISACRGGSAKTITAVMPYFPYSRQSKKKHHRGPITARMVANLLGVAGVQRVITVDLHAPPMKGFFSKPIDNLFAEPIIARWIRHNVQGWKDAVVVGKNPGGSKRVTSLADALKLNFAIITTARRRSPHRGGESMTGSYIEDREEETRNKEVSEKDFQPDAPSQARGREMPNMTSTPNRMPSTVLAANPLQKSAIPEDEDPGAKPLSRARTAPELGNSFLDEDGEEYTDEKAQEVITARLVQGHVVEDSFTSPIISPMVSNTNRHDFDTDFDPMTTSFMSNASSMHNMTDHPLGGTYDAEADSEEEDPTYQSMPQEIEHTVTLVGNVAGRTALIMDDIIDRADSWIAAAETVVKRGGAKAVYCIATHGLFGDRSLEELAACSCIDRVVVCNTFPLDAARAKSCGEKLVVLDLSPLLAEAIRRNHHGESISHLYQQFQD